MALPKIVYVYEDTEANGKKYLAVAREAFDAAADDGTHRLVGTYDECRPCWYCGTYTDDWDYIGRQRVALCSANECVKEMARANRDVEEEAEQDAAEDRYERYF